MEGILAWIIILSICCLAIAGSVIAGAIEPELCILIFIYAVFSNPHKDKKK